MLALIDLELIGHPEQRAIIHGAVIAGQPTIPALTTRPPSSIKCGVRLRHSICQDRMSWGEMCS